VEKPFPTNSSLFLSQTLPGHQNRAGLKNQSVESVETWTKKYIRCEPLGFALIQKFVHYCEFCNSCLENLSKIWSRLLKSKWVLRKILLKREELRQQLRAMNPYQFEQLIGDLLEAMGYEDVTVTKASGDYGVDVVATVQFGITTITEVVQVKRYQNTIQRHTLDQLRGALPYYKALRGTIITLSRFSSGCIEAALFPGAAPIGLIDGEKLLDLLFKHSIGIKKRSLDLYELDEDYLTAPDELGEAQQILREELD